MYKSKSEKEICCPLEYGMELFGGKWKSRIICVLSQMGTMRYSTLRSELANITDAVLAATLKELMVNDMIERIQYNEIPPKVEYTLSEKGKSVVPILHSICQWSGMYYNENDGPALKHCQKCNYRNRT